MDWIILIPAWIIHFSIIFFLNQIFHNFNFYKLAMKECVEKILRYYLSR